MGQRGRTSGTYLHITRLSGRRPYPSSQNPKSSAVSITSASSATIPGKGPWQRFRFCCPRHPCAPRAIGGQAWTIPRSHPRVRGGLRGVVDYRGRLHEYVKNDLDLPRLSHGTHLCQLGGLVVADDDFLLRVPGGSCGSVRMAMSQSRLMMSDRTASSSGLMAGFRDLIESMKFWSWRWLLIRRYFARSEL